MNRDCTIFIFSFATITPSFFILDLISLCAKKKTTRIKKKYNKKIFEDKKTVTTVMLINITIDLIIPNIKKVISPTDDDFVIIVEIKDDEFSF